VKHRGKPYPLVAFVPDEGAAPSRNVENGITLIEEGTYPNDHNIGPYQGR
jgi:hypothetical protein